jgi:hypothetical protein
MQEENRGCDEGPRGGCNNFGGPFGGNGCGCGDNGILFFIIIFLLLFTNSGCCGRG